MFERIQIAKDYRQDQIESDEIDLWLGMNTSATEAIIQKKQSTHQLWLHVPLQTALTPYSEIFFMLQALKLKKGETIIDLGSGYNRMAFVVGHFFSDVQFIGYEVSPERVNESLKALKEKNYPNVLALTVDLSDKNFTPAIADYYFIYDYGTREAIEKTLYDLQKIAKEKNITVIGRGRASRDAIERHHPWLSQVNPPEHHAHYSVYRS